MHLKRYNERRFSLYSIFPIELFGKYLLSYVLPREMFHGMADIMLNYQYGKEVVLSAKPGSP